MPAIFSLTHTVYKKKDENIKIRSWGGVTDPKVSSAIMVGHWATAIIKVLYLENQTFEDWKQNARRQNAVSLV